MTQRSSRRITFGIYRIFVKNTVIEPAYQIIQYAGLFIWRGWGLICIALERRKGSEVALVGRKGKTWYVLQATLVPLKP